MKRFIPDFILKNFRAGNINGSLSAETMFLDLSGFTGMTESLMQHGKYGAESLSEILNTVFQAIIDKIYFYKGFITTFAGDALTAVFPDEDFFSDNSEQKPQSRGQNNGISRCPARALFAAVDIRSFFKENAFFATQFGEFEVCVKIGLAYGNVSWGILGTRTHKTYYFKGTGIDDCSYAEHCCNKGDLVVHKNFLGHISRFIGSKTAINHEFWKINGFTDKLSGSKDVYIQKHCAEPSPVKEAGNKGDGGADSGETREEMYTKQKIFIPENVINFQAQGEFRDIHSVFISFNEPGNRKKLNSLITSVIRECDDHGGYFNSLDFGDKGGTLLIFFGAPVSYENNRERALRFSASVLEKLGNRVRMGIVSGIAYAGIIGIDQRCAYTCLGDTVNLSARFMMKAEFGDVWISKEIEKQAAHDYKTQSLGNMSFKGKSGTIAVFRLISVLSGKKSSFQEHGFIDRKNEIKSLKGFLYPVEDKPYKGFCYIYGEAGTGKSRLIKQMINMTGQGGKNKGKIRYLILEPDNILKKGFNCFIPLLSEIFLFNPHKKDHQESNKNKGKIIEKSTLFDMNFQNFIVRVDKSAHELGDTIKNELVRTRSFLEALADIHHKGSLYEQLEPKLRYENTVTALSFFLLSLPLYFHKEQVVFVLEDLQYLDNDSPKVFKAMNFYASKMALGFIILSRLNDDGTKPVLREMEQKPLLSICLGNLGNRHIPDYLKSRFNAEPDTQLLDLINRDSLGNPFYMEQMCQYLLDQEMVEIKEGKAFLNGGKQDIPRGIQSVIIARIDRLAGKIKQTAQIASILGKKFDSGILTEMIHVSDKALHDYNPELIREIGEKENLWETLNESDCYFKSTLLQETIYEMQLKARLKKLHNLAGSVMENLRDFGEKDYLEIGRHFDLGEKFEKAAGYLEKAGNSAAENFDHDTAVHCLKRVAEILETDTGSFQSSDENRQMVRKQKVLIRLARELETMGKYSDAEAIYLSNIRESEPLENQNLYAENLLRYGWVFLEKGEYDKGKEYCEKAKGIFEKLRIPDKIGRSENNIGVYHFYKSQYGEAIRHFQEAEKFFRESETLKDPEKDILIQEKKKMGASICNNIGLCFDNLKNYEQSALYLNKSMELALKEKNKVDQALAYSNLGNLLYNTGDFKKAEHYYSQALEIDREIGSRREYGIHSYNLARLYHEIYHDYPRAVKMQEENFELFQVISYPYAIPYVLDMLGNGYLALGNTDESEKILFRGLDYADQMDNTNEKLNLSNNLGNLYRMAGKDKKAREFYMKTLDLMEKTGAYSNETEVRNRIFELDTNNKQIKTAKSILLEKKKETAGDNEGENLLRQAWLLLIEDTDLKEFPEKMRTDKYLDITGKMEQGGFLLPAAQVYLKLGDLTKNKEYLSEASVILNKLIKTDPHAYHKKLLDTLDKMI